jgi:hypothetical protein
MTDEATDRLSGDQVMALRFAAHRQLARWSNKPRLSPHQHAQRTALRAAVRILQVDAFSGSGWCMHDCDHATLHDARAYVEGLIEVESWQVMYRHEDARRARVSRRKATR